jgi:hypothetical protein
VPLPTAGLTQPPPATVSILASVARLLRAKEPIATEAAAVGPFYGSPLLRADYQLERRLWKREAEELVKGAKE